VSGYRERRDPRLIAEELLREASERETQALIAKHSAQIELQSAEAARDVAQATRGAKVNVLRHVEAAARAREAAPEGAAPDPERGARAEAERAGWLRARGFEPGPEVETLGPDALAAELSTLEDEVQRAEADVRSAEARIETARAALAESLDRLAEATRARERAQAEATALARG
jgi:hypothetical protein